MREDAQANPPFIAALVVSKRPPYLPAADSSNTPLNSAASTASWRKPLERAQKLLDIQLRMNCCECSLCATKR